MHEAVREDAWIYSAWSGQYHRRSKPSVKLQQLARMFGVGVLFAKILALHSSHECLAWSRALGTSMSTFLFFSLALGS